MKFLKYLLSYFLPIRLKGITCIRTKEREGQANPCLHNQATGSTHYRYSDFYFNTFDLKLNALKPEHWSNTELMDDMLARLGDK